MSLQLSAIGKINSLPENLLQEVNDFIDFITLKYNSQINNNFAISNLTETDFSDYLKNLENYETALEEGKVKW